MYVPTIVLAVAFSDAMPAELVIAATDIDVRLAPVEGALNKTGTVVSGSPSAFLRLTRIGAANGVRTFVVCGAPSTIARTEDCANAVPVSAMKVRKQKQTIRFTMTSCHPSNVRMQSTFC